MITNRDKYQMTNMRVSSQSPLIGYASCSYNLVMLVLFYRCLTVSRAVFLTGVQLHVFIL